MSTIDTDQNWCLGAAHNVGSEQTFTLTTKGAHLSAIQPASDPVKLDPNLSPLEGDQASTSATQFSFTFYSDAVD
jgi:hypothetical protein